MSISTNKTSYAPGETIYVNYNFNSYKSSFRQGSAWVGLIPSSCTSNSEHDNDYVDVYYFRPSLSGSGTMSYSRPGTYYVKAFADDGGGVKMGPSVLISITGTDPALQQRLRDLEAQVSRYRGEMQTAARNLADRTSQLTAQRQEMENRFRQQIANAAADHKRQLESQRESHRREHQQREAQNANEQLAVARKQQTLVNEMLTHTTAQIAEVEGVLSVEQASLNSIHNLLIRETSARRKFEALEGESLKLVLLGNTGDGKSTLANRLTGDTSKKGDRGAFATSAGLASATQLIQTAFVDRIGRRFCIADTPGGGDSGGNDRLHATNMVDFLHGIGEVRAFVLVRNFQNPRLSAHDQAILKAFSDLLGESFWKNVMVVFTRVDDEDDMEELEERRGEFRDRLGEMFSLTSDEVNEMPVLGIGKRNYTAQVEPIFEAALNCNRGCPFRCQRLIAPVEERQRAFEEQQSVVARVRSKLDKLLVEKGTLVAQQSSAQALVAKWSQRR